MRNLMLARALEILIEARDQGKSALGMDKTRIFEPLALLQRKIGCSRQTANKFVRELEISGAVTLYKEGVGDRIESLVIRRDLFEAPPSESGGPKERLQRALVQRKRASQIQPGSFVVLQQDFRFVRRDAGIGEGPFYVLLKDLEQGGAVKIVRKPNKRIDYVRLAEACGATAAA